MTSNSEGMLAAVKADPSKAPILADALEDGDDYGDAETLAALRSGEPVTLLAGRKLFARPSADHPTESHVALAALRAGASPNDLHDGSPPVVGPVQGVASRFLAYHSPPAVSVALSALDSLYHGSAPQAMGHLHGTDRHLIHAGYNDTPEDQHRRWADIATRWLVGSGRHDLTAATLRGRDRRHAALRVAGGLLTVLAGEEHAEPFIRQAEKDVADRDAADEHAETVRRAERMRYADLHAGLTGAAVAHHEAEAATAFRERRVRDGNTHKMIARQLSQPGFVAVEFPDTMRGTPPAGTVWYKHGTSDRWGKSAKIKHGRALTAEELEAVHKRRGQR